MTNDLLSKIDTLITMSKSVANYDTLKAELTEIEEEVQTKRKEIEELKSNMQDEKYIKASDRIIDENIKVSLELKIQNLKNNCKKLENDLKQVLESENKAHIDLERWQAKVEKIKQLLVILNEKISTISKSDKETSSYYQSLISENEKKLEHAEANVILCEEEYQLITEDLDKKTKDLEEKKAQLEEEKEKLSATKKNLETNVSYVDKNRKKEDEKRLEELKTKIVELQTRKEEILKDPVYIGNEAKNLLLEDDRTGSIVKLKELIRNIKTQPYMDITDSSDVDNILKEAEKRALAERDEFASLMENKKYDGANNPVLTNRQKYLEQQKKDLNTELDNLKKKIKRIDATVVRSINMLLTSAQSNLETIKKELEEYKKVMENAEENSTPKKKAVLIAAYKKKEEEIKNVQNIIDSYESEMEEYILESQTLGEKNILEIQTKIDKVEASLKELDKKKMTSSKATDVLALENDKAKLKEYNDNIAAIEFRRQFSKTPSEIFDEIEISLSSVKDFEEAEEEKPKNYQEEPLNTNFRITSDYESNKDFNRSEKNKNILEFEEAKKLKNSVNETYNLPWDDANTSSVDESTTSDYQGPIPFFEESIPSSTEPDNTRYFEEQNTIETPSSFTLENDKIENEAKQEPIPFFGGPIPTDMEVPNNIEESNPIKESSVEETSSLIKENESNIEPIPFFGGPIPTNMEIQNNIEEPNLINQSPLGGPAPLTLENTQKIEGPGINEEPVPFFGGPIPTDMEVQNNIEEPNLINQNVENTNPIPLESAKTTENEETIPEQTPVFKDPITSNIENLENMSIPEPTTYVPESNQMFDQNQQYQDITPQEPINLFQNQPVEPQPIIEEINPISDNQTPIEELNKMPSTPVTERYRVINIEELEEPKEQKGQVEQNDVMVNDFKDDDYIDFDSIIGGGSI